jgi:hypothetical protein
MLHVAWTRVYVHAPLPRAVRRRQFVHASSTTLAYPRVPWITPRVPRSAVSARLIEQVREAAEASGLLPLFQTLHLDTDAQSLERAGSWLADQGARTVGDLRELPPGTYACSKLADGLGLPMLTAQRLLTALEGAKDRCIHICVGV